MTPRCKPSSRTKNSLMDTGTLASLSMKKKSISTVIVERGSNCDVLSLALSEILRSE